jgi:hypothetical protein
MKDINKETLQMIFFLNDAKKQYNTFLRKHVYEAVGSLPIMLSLLPHVLLREMSSLPVFCKCGESCFAKYYQT